MSPHAHAKMPLDQLREEHEVILDVLGNLERWLDRLEAGKPAPAATLDKAVEFFTGFADSCHHAKEEMLLFPKLEEGGPFGPVSAMLEEHEEGRSCIAALADGLSTLETDAGRKKVLANGRHYVTLLRAHIDKENGVLFPLAERMLSPDDMHGLAHAFEDAEEELGPEEHERFLGLAKEIERAVAS